MKQRTEVNRLLGRLRDMVEDSDVPRHVVDARLGRAPGYLSQLLAGTIDLKYRHLMTILEAIGCPPARFFEVAYPRPTQRPAGPASPRLATVLRGEREAVEVYGVGIEAVAELRERLTRCEASLRAVLTEEP